MIPWLYDINSIWCCFLECFMGYYSCFVRGRVIFPSFIGLIWVSVGHSSLMVYYMSHFGGVSFGKIRTKKYNQLIHKNQQSELISKHVMYVYISCTSYILNLKGKKLYKHTWNMVKKYNYLLQCTYTLHNLECR